MKNIDLAHVHRNQDGTWAEPHYLLDHLAGTANLAEEFARPFASEAWAKACGYGHDTGKGAAKWQLYLASKSGYFDESAHLETSPGKLDHSAPSSKLVEEVFGKGIGRILSYCIAGHHAGLPNWLGDQGALAYRLQNADSTAIPEQYSQLLNSLNPMRPPRKFDSKGLDLSLWIRMLFSCLVDADCIHNNFEELY